MGGSAQRWGKTSSARMRLTTVRVNQGVANSHAANLGMFPPFAIRFYHSPGKPHRRTRECVCAGGTGCHSSAPLRFRLRSRTGAPTALAPFEKEMGR